METSESLDEIGTALALAQGKIDSAKKDSTNPHFKNNYADLSSVWEACREQLSSNGISVIQAPGETAEGKMWMTTMLLHKSGQYIKEVMSIPLSKVDAQGYGSATTYARRYALAAMVGVAPDDDDGNAASRPAASAVANDAPAARQQPEKLKGFYKTRAAARTGYAEIVRELHACADADMLLAFLVAVQPQLEQFENELPSAWLGDGQDFIGLAKEIDNAKIRVELAD